MRQFLVLAALLPGLAFAAEGMWTFDNLPTAKINQQYGFNPDHVWVDKVMHASARIANGCSASFISPNGLILSNHHCAASCVEQLSSATQDYLATGFLAKSPADEIRCPEIEINRLEQISDVTKAIKSATQGLDGTAFKKAQDAERARLTQHCVGDQSDTKRCDVVELYHGGQYHLYQYHRFQDVRLAFVPEQAMGSFGGDPDNFNFPRYALDMSVLRVYENGKPAHTSDYFPLKAEGAKAGELTFVTGHPGTTNRQRTVAQLETIRDVVLPRRLLGLAQMRGMLTQYSASGTEQARTAYTDLFFLENRYKALYGQLQALLNPALIKQKQADETSLRAFVNADPKLKASTGGAWDAIAQAQNVYKQIEVDYIVKERLVGFDSRYFEYARHLVRGTAERALPNASRLPEYHETDMPQMEQQLFSKAPLYPDFEKAKLTASLTKMRELLGADDSFVHDVLGKQSPAQVATALIDGTHLADVAQRQALWQGGVAAIKASDDPMIKLALKVDPAARAVRGRYEQDVEAVENKNAELISQARFAQLGNSVYPDATSTLRLSYGEVAGWQERGQPVPPFTYFGGAFERATGVEPFVLPPSWLAAKDQLNMQEPFDFVTTNDVIGGNSGSPVINQQGQIVGLIFDGNIHSLGGAFYYDDKTNRSVAVHSGAILQALDKIYHAGNLVTEMREGTLAR